MAVTITRKPRASIAAQPPTQEPALESIGLAPPAANDALLVFPESAQPVRFVPLGRALPPLAIHYQGSPTHFSPYEGLIPAQVEKPAKKRSAKKKKAEEVIEPSNWGPPLPPVDLGPVAAPEFKLKEAEGEKSKTLWTRTGIEYTFLPREYSKKLKYNDEDDSDGCLLRAGYFFMKAELLKNPKTRPLGRRAYLDGHVVEVPSTPVCTWRGLYSEYSNLWLLAQKYNLRAQSPVVGTGSNHINVDLPYRLIARLLRDLANRPYIYWAFNDPCDVQDGCIPSEADSGVGLTPERISELLITLDGRDHVNKLSVPREQFLYYTRDEKLAAVMVDRYGIGSKGPVRIHVGSRHSNHFHGLERPPETRVAEMRIFESPEGWPQLKLQVAFVDAWLRYLAKIKFYEQEPPKWMHRHDVALAAQKGDINFEWAKEEFNAFLRTLGLKPKKYEKYVEYNLRQRFALGNDYLR